MKNGRVKKSLEKSKDVLEKKRKVVKRKKIAQKKTNTFTIIAMNLFQEQLVSFNQHRFFEIDSEIKRPVK